jgi:biotin transport system ATP-binding protein
MTAVKLRHIRKTFHTADGAERDNPIHALNDVSLDVERGSTAIVAGENGSGKSLLMYIIAKLEDPSSGAVSVDGKVALVFQNADNQILGETPREDVAIGIPRKGTDKGTRAAIVDAALDATGLKGKADRPARFLSGGEKRRLAVAGAIAMNADVVIFDEPYANLDYPGVVSVNSLIVELKEQDKTIIILTHELEKCLKLADRLVILHKGTVVFDGTPDSGLKQNLTSWGIRHPLRKQDGIEDLLWQ